VSYYYRTINSTLYKPTSYHQNSKERSMANCVLDLASDCNTK